MTYMLTSMPGGSDPAYLGTMAWIIVLHNTQCVYMHTQPEINEVWLETDVHPSPKDPVKPMNWNNLLQLDWEF